MLAVCSDQGRLLLGREVGDSSLVYVVRQWVGNSSQFSDFISDGCLERVPFVSLIGFILVVCGSGIMCGTNFEALKRIDDFFENRFYPVDE